jgi:hypothetical protein
VEQYLAEWLELGRRARIEQDQNPPPVVTRLRALKAEIKAAGSSPEHYLHDLDEAQASSKDHLIAA